MEKKIIEKLLTQINNPRLLEITEDLKGDERTAAKLLIPIILEHLERAS